GQFLFTQIAAKKIRSADITYEKRIAGKDAIRFPGRVRQEVAGAFKSMPRRVQYPDLQGTHGKYLMIFGFVKIKTGICFRPINYSCSRFFREFQMSAYKVCMEMGLKNIFD